MEELPSFSEYGKIFDYLEKKSTQNIKIQEALCQFFSDLLSEYITMKDVGFTRFRSSADSTVLPCIKLSTESGLRPGRMLCGRWRSLCS